MLPGCTWWRLCWKGDTDIGTAFSLNFLFAGANTSGRHSLCVLTPFKVDFTLRMVAGPRTNESEARKSLALGRECQSISQWGFSHLTPGPGELPSRGRLRKLDPRSTVSLLIYVFLLRQRPLTLPRWASKIESPCLNSQVLRIQACATMPTQGNPFKTGYDQAK